MKQYSISTFLHHTLKICIYTGMTATTQVCALPTRQHLNLPVVTSSFKLVSCHFWKYISIFSITNAYYSILFYALIIPFFLTLFLAHEYETILPGLKSLCNQDLVLCAGCQQTTRTISWQHVSNTCSCQGEIYRCLLFSYIKALEP